MRLTLILLLFTLLAKGQNCSFITKSVDKFDSTTKYNSPFINPIIVYKSINKADTTYFMSITVNGGTLNVDKKGVKILLADGTRIEKLETNIKVSADNNGSGYNYRAFFRLNEEDIEKLLKTTITDYRLYIYDGTVSERGGKVYQNIMKCLVNSH